MVITNISKAKASLSKPIERVQRGEEVVIGKALQRYRFTPLDITSEHALAVEALPHHHSDPFDRLLVAQAKVERLMIVTHDRRIAQYGTSVLMT